MREILFRGQRVGTKEWVYGFYNHFKERHGGKHKHYIQTCKETGEIDLLREVDPETVGQYTDLTDKNGIRIFEGDVIRAYSDIGAYDFTAEVEWGNFIKGWYCGKYRPMYDGFNNEYEVIGNKWDNPELLEGGAE